MEYMAFGQQQDVPDRVVVMPICQCLSWVRKDLRLALVNLCGCTIGDDTKIGAVVEVQKKATLGCRCKVYSYTFILRERHHRR
jgi:hypothetical protein